MAISWRPAEDPIRILICGAGSSAHALAGIISSRDGVDVQVLTHSEARAETWNRQLRTAPLAITGRNHEPLPEFARKSPLSVTSDPGEAAPGCDIVLFAAPAFLHWQFLVAIEPYIRRGCMIVGLPGQCGFEFDVRKALGRKADSCVLMNFDSLPWVCRIVEFGRSVQISATKAKLVGAMQGDLSLSGGRDPRSVLQWLLGARPELTVSGHLLGITLRSPNSFSHPPMMYARWKDWDGVPLDRPPLFYREADEATVDIICKVNGEVLEIARSLSGQYPEADLSQVVSAYDWDLGCYEDVIEDKTNLLTLLRTNSGYAGIPHPMIRTEDGGYVPDYGHRFLSEDIPFGLVVVRSIAEIAGTPTPYIDEVLTWCQEKMGKQYLVGSSLTGRDLADTRCAGRYGFATAEEILGFESALAAASAR